MEAGGLTSLLMLLRNTEDETIHRVAAGAIANLAMNGNKILFSLVHSLSLSYYIIFFVFCLVNQFIFTSLTSETNQELIMDQGGIDLLSSTAANAQDPQTLRMVAGAIANLCGNGIFYSEYINLFVD